MLWLLHPLITLAESEFCGSVKKELKSRKHRVIFIVYRRNTINSSEVMALSKRSEFLKPEVRLADFAKALSHPARIAIIKILAERGVCMCGQVVEELPLAQATVSQHLRALKDAGLIRGEIEGPRTCYCLDPEGLRAFSHCIRFFMDQIERIVTPLNEGEEQ